MKKIVALTVLAVVFALSSGTHAQVTGRIFQVGVRSSFGTNFMDCFRFDVPNTGDLTIDRLFQTITYRHGQLNEVATRFKAVSRSGQPLSIMFYGEEVEGLELLVGEAVNAFGDTFVFAGLETSNCLLGAPSLENPYGRRTE